MGPRAAGQDRHPRQSLMLPRSDSPYGRWCAWLTAFSTGSDEPVDGLRAMDPEALGGTVCARLATRCADAFQARLALWLRAFQHDAGGVASLEAYERAVGAARHRLAPIRAFVSSPLLTEELRIALSDALRDNLSSFQSTLEGDAA